MNGKKWSRKDTRSISKEFRDNGMRISANTIGELLKDQDYSLRVNRKTIAETQHPDRNAQFEIIAATRKQFEDAGQPVLSVDTKKKELIGNFKNNGKTWRKESDNVLVHDFRSEANALAVPYGVYETTLNRGTVVVGVSAETAEFAVDSIEMWMDKWGWQRYPGMKKMLILCDAGGANGYRVRLWKYALYYRISQAYGIEITVCHYPSGASKWNPVEHRLFSFISNEWAGIPLRSLAIMLRCIESTTTRTGLEVSAILNEKQYQKGIRISDRGMKEISLKRGPELPAWNYTISPNVQ